MSRFSPMSEIKIGAPLSPSRLLPPVIPASRSRKLDGDSESETSGIYGPTSSTLCAFYDHESSCWRMSQCTLDLGLMPSSVILPKRGSMRSGRLYGRPMLDAATVESDCSLLLPTPAADDSGNSPENHLRKKPGRTKVTSLRVMARGKLLPTPTVSDAKGPSPNHNRTTAEVITKKLLPTPAAWDGSRGPDYAKADRPDSGMDDLVTFMARLTGGSTGPRSNATNDSLDDLRLFPLTTVED